MAKSLILFLTVLSILQSFAASPDYNPPINKDALDEFYRRFVEDFERRSQAAAIERGMVVPTVPVPMQRGMEFPERGMGFPTFPEPTDPTPTNFGRREGRTETYEECQAGLPKGVRYVADPCRGKPHAGGNPYADLEAAIDMAEKFGPIPKSMRPSAPIGLPPQQSGMDSVIQAGANFLGNFLGNLIRGNK